ncbi:MAG TPA: ABC transporter substrate binding protein [Alphaproteobacteria bacterium]|nr:ABC transporter substrate binding protein [Alphaproteobacteria bacterium]
MAWLKRPLLSLLLLVVFIGPASARPVLDWLTYDPDVLERYDVAQHPEDTARQIVTPRWAGKQGPAPKRILLLIPIKTPTAYSVSVSTILRDFYTEQLPAEFIVWFFERKQDVAKEALDWSIAEKLDMIIPVGSAATEYLHANYRNGDIPVVTSASKDPVLQGQIADYEKGSGTNFAYTSINVPVDTQFAYLRQLMPTLKNIVLVYAKVNSSAVATQVKPLEAAAPRYGMQIIECSVENEKTAVADLEANMPKALTEALQRDPAMKETIVLLTGSSEAYEQIATINRLAGRVPVVSMLPDVVRPGDDSAMISIGVNQSSAVHLAARYAIAILQGKAKVGELKVGVVNPPDIAINFKRVRQAGIQIPFPFFESATFIYDYDGRQVRAFGQRVVMN